MDVQDEYELRKIILGQLLTFNDNEFEGIDNEFEDNIPVGVLEFLSCIKKIKIKTAM